MLFFSIIAFILMLSFLVIIHEMGHFLTARFFKIKIEEFGIGYPPRARTLFTWKGIPFTLNWIPVGGFVRMEGEDGVQIPDVKAETKTKAKKQVELYAPFNTKPRWQRLIVILAGASVNFIFGVIAFTVIYSYVGIPVPVTPPETLIVQVNDGPAKLAKLQENDQIVHALDSRGNQISVTSSQEFMQWVVSRPDTDIVVTVKRDGKLIDAKLHTRQASEVQKLGAMSVTLAEPIEHKFYPWYRMPFESAKFGLTTSLDFSKLILSGLGKMATDFASHGKVPTDVAGPVGIVSAVYKQKLFSGGWLEILNFAAMFSINLAVMNVLPIPALDGGRAFFIILETFLGRKLISKIEGHANLFGFGLLFALIILISIKDVIGLFR